MTTSRLAACDPTQWVQSLIAIQIHVNQETHRDIITKKFFQGGLSAVTAVTCIPACGTEIIKLVGDVSCKATGGAIRGVQYIVSPAWLESFYQTVSGRPSLSYRVERIVGQAFGLFISACGIFLRGDWTIQQHQSLGNYIPSKTSPPETSKGSPSSQTSEVPPPESSAETSPPKASGAPTAPPPPSAKANPSLLKSALKPLLPAADTGSSSPPDPRSPSDEHAPLSEAPAGSEPPPDSSSAPAADLPKRKKKGVRITSTPTEAKPPASPLDEIKRRGQEQSSKGEETAVKLQEDERAKQGKKTLSSEGKAISGALTSQKAKVRRHQSAYFKGFDATLGNLVDGKIILRDLAKDLSNIPFSTDEQILSRTFGEYVLLKFEEDNTPIKNHQVCVITDEDWGQTFTITIVNTEKDPTTGKDIILEAAISW